MRAGRGACGRVGALATTLAIALAAVAAAQGTPPAGDDHYRFLPGAGQEQRVALSRTTRGVSWTWPAAARQDWDTALLGVRVDAGGVVSPWVEASAGTASVQQYFEAGAAGLRWLNLTGLKPGLAGGTRVEIVGHGATLQPGPASLRLFASKLPLDGTVLILAPHPDDAEIAAFGLYSQTSATVVTVTAGNAGDFNYRASVSDPAEHYKLKGYLRAVDSVTVPWQGGVPPDRCFNMGYFDARLATMHDKPDQAVAEMYGPNQDVAVYRRADISHLLPTGPRTNTWNHLVEDMVTVLEKVNPAVVVMPHPFLDTHPDHEFVSVAAVEALGRWKGSPRFLLYTNHAYHGQYPFGPPGTVMSLPPWSGRELPVAGIYSHPVDHETQVRKLFALESMHDLRFSPAEQEACGYGEQILRRPDYPRTYAVDYFRRGVRSDELFFVFDRRGVTDLIHSFLSERSGSHE